MANTAATSVDLGNGNSNEDKWGSVAVEVWNLTDAAVISGDTFTATTKINNVQAVINLPIEWTWSQSGETVTVNVLGSTTTAPVNREILVIGTALL